MFYHERRKDRHYPKITFRRHKPNQKRNNSRPVMFRKSCLGRIVQYTAFYELPLMSARQNLIQPLLMPPSFKTRPLPSSKHAFMLFCWKLNRTVQAAVQGSIVRSERASPENAYSTNLPVNLYFFYLSVFYAFKV